MTAGLDSNQFASSYAPGTYYCPECFAFVPDCAHLVEPLDMPRVKVDDPILVSIGYDRGQRILELEDNVGAVYRYDKVTRATAVAIAKNPGSANELLKGKRFRRVRKIGIAKSA